MWLCVHCTYLFKLSLQNDLWAFLNLHSYFQRLVYLLYYMYIYVFLILFVTCNWRYKIKHCYRCCCCCWASCTFVLDIPAHSLLSSMVEICTMWLFFKLNFTFPISHLPKLVNQCKPRIFLSHLNLSLFQGFLWMGSWIKSLSDFWSIARFLFPCICPSVKQKENMTFHQKSLRASKCHY